MLKKVIAELLAAFAALRSSKLQESAHQITFTSTQRVSEYRQSGESGTDSVPTIYLGCEYKLV